MSWDKGKKYQTKRIIIDRSRKSHPPNSIYFLVFNCMCVQLMCDTRGKFLKVLLVSELWDQSDPSGSTPPSSSHGLHVIAKEVRPSYIYACMFLKKTAASFLNSSSDQQLEDSSSFYFFQTHISEEGIKLTKMPANFCGSWEIISNVNFEGYMIALGKSLKHINPTMFSDITSLLNDFGCLLFCCFVFDCALKCMQI